MRPSLIVVVDLAVSYVLKEVSYVLKEEGL